jgi:nondiscriminating aspartyl-tRNA synthetase
MQNRIFSNNLKEHTGKTIVMKGWLHTLRKLGSIAFLILRDKNGLSQIVLERAEEIEKLENLYTGTILEVEGNVIESPKSKFGYEIHDGTVKVVHPVKYPNPVDISKENLNVELDTLLENRVVTLRHPKQASIFKIYAIAEKQIRQFFYNNDFTQFNSPKIIAFPTEGGSEVFEVSYFDRKAYLAQSPQFYKQIMVTVFEKVFEIGKAYRAENSNTSRHISEIVMLDAEMGFIDSFDDVLETAQNLLKFAVTETWKEGEKELQALNATRPILSDEFPRITVAELHKLMLKETGEDHSMEEDVAPSEEKFICEYSIKNWGSEAVFVTEFPWSSAKFYHYQNKQNPKVTDRADMIFRGLEVATVTRREVDYDKMIAQIKAQGIDPTSPGLSQYLDSFKYGMPDEGGFGLGITRLVQKLIGLLNIKEAELFPSDTKMIGAIRLATKIYTGKDLYSEIIKRLETQKIEYKLMEHEAVTTSEEASKIRNSKLSEGVKALILRGKTTQNNIMVCIPADQKLDFDLLEKLQGEKFAFEKPEEIKKSYGIEVGGIPPFGNLLGLTTYFSKAVLSEKRAIFNCGLRTKSIEMDSQDLIELAKPILI